MRLLILSDLHLEFAPFTPPQVDCDAVILAGDIHPGYKGLTWAVETFPHSEVIYILGNHEYYRQAIPRHVEKLKLMAEGSNVHVLENNCFILDNIVFLGCTLWTDFKMFGDPRIAGFFATQNMTDYKLIRLSSTYSKLRSVDTAGFHYHSRQWLGHQFDQYRGKKVVAITHHAPSTRSLPENYLEDILSAAYASHLDEFIENSGACLWIHGHKHRSKDYMIGETRIINNPRGYPHKINPEFNPGLLINI